MKSTYMKKSSISSLLLLLAASIGYAGDGYTLSETGSANSATNMSLAYYDTENGTVSYKDVEIADKVINEDGTTYYYTWQNLISVNADRLAVSETEPDSYAFSVTVDADSVTVNATQLTDNEDIIANKDADFINNSSSAYGGAIYITESITVDLTGDFIGNTSSAEGGAIYIANGVIFTGDISGDFIANSATGAKSCGAFYNAGTVAGTISGDFISNGSGKNRYAGALYNSGEIYAITGSFYSNYGAYDGGAIQNTGTIYAMTGSFIGNSNTGQAGNYEGTSMGGGAIYNTTSGTIYFVTNDSDIEFTGNTSISSKLCAISNAGTLYFDAYNSNTISVNDAINYYVNRGTLIVNQNATNSYIGITEAQTFSTVEFNNAVYLQDISVYGGTLSLGSANINGTTYNAELRDTTITLESGATLSIDAALTISSSSSLDSSESTTYSTSYIYAKAGSTVTIEDGASIIIDMLDLEVESFVFAKFDSEDDLKAFLVALEMIDSSAELSDENLVSGLVSAKDNDGDLTYGTDYEFYLSEDGTYGIGISHIVAVPEPSTYAMIFGLFALAFAYYRRRKQ